MSASAITSVARELLYIARLFARTLLLVFVPFSVPLMWIHFPREVDPSLHSEAKRKDQSTKRRDAEFYTVAYTEDPKTKRGLDYEQTAKAAAEHFGIEGLVREFVQEHGLQNKKVLEVGSGRGYLQDIVSDYTGLDLSPSVAKNYHKPFVAGSATEMPFPDSSFDAIWSVWVLEHISEPERALQEMRRVLKPGGLLFLYVAWECPSWLAEGFDVRPYSDFNWRGKLLKASLLVRKRSIYTASYLFPIRVARWSQYTASGASEPLRFRSLEPNYDIYWESDSDAAITLDSFETYMWFRSRGDRCMNCGNDLQEMATFRQPLIVKVRKEPAPPRRTESLQTLLR